MELMSKGLYGPTAPAAIQIAGENSPTHHSKKPGPIMSAS